MALPPLPIEEAHGWEPGSDRHSRVATKLPRYTVKLTGCTNILEDGLEEVHGLRLRELRALLEAELRALQGGRGVRLARKDARWPVHSGNNTARKG